MNLENLRINEIPLVTKAGPGTKYWINKNRRDHQIGIKISGRHVIKMSDKELNMSEDCFYFLNNKDDYAVEVQQRGINYSVYFTTYEPIEDESFVLKVKNPGEVIRLIEAVDRYSSAANGSNMVLSNLYKLFAYVNDLRIKSYRPSDIRLLKAREYMDMHFKEKNCLQKTVDLSGISSRRFNDIFKNYFEITPARYITERKIETAKKLLSENEVPISEVARLSGFEKSYYFCRVFKAETGMSPSEYRKK